MAGTAPDVVVCGHICLDIIPRFDGGAASLEEVLVPGKLVHVGPAVISTGGAVSNTGQALHRLGVSTGLMGKIGDDLFGHAVLEVMRGLDPGLAEGMIISQEVSTSYTLVINPPGVDRVFLHCPGANDDFGADDIPYDRLAGTRIFHFGYPPLMRRMYGDEGGELESLLRRVRAQGVTTSLDMARPDPASAAGRTRWPNLLARVLPHVDLFLPSLDEMLFMLDRAQFTQVEAEGDLARVASAELLRAISDQLLTMGAAVVALKLGPYGLYVRTAGARRLASVPLFADRAGAAWADRELLAPCFQAEVVGTTGSGDCTVAGFLAGALHGLPPEQAMTAAVAVGACSVEAADATSGVRKWAAVQERIRGGWRRHPVALSLRGWQWDDSRQVVRSERDGRRTC